ncbi:MAG: Ppx/GppA phosphatase family protein [Daejeonella sp.]
MRVAILDLGTNTFHLLIADISPAKKPEVICKETIAVKLGEGGISKGHISVKAFNRGIEALKKFKTSIDKYHPELIKSAATSAIRSASNGLEFIESVKTETGIDLEIIDGNQEAQLIYQGVRAAINIDRPGLIVDIGGGSVEFIICDSSGIIWKKSYLIGTARLMDKFHRSDPISETDIEKLCNFLDQTLADLKVQLNLHKPEMLIGSAGAFETFAQLQDMGFKAEFDHPEFTIHLDKFWDISDNLIASVHADRVRMTEIPPVRVDMIVVASILVKYILEISGAKSLKLSVYSLKEGILFGLLK